MNYTADDLIKVLHNRGLDTLDKVDAFLANALKPVSRAAIQAQIDAENKQFEADRQAHNDALAALQAKLNAV